MAQSFNCPACGEAGYDVFHRVAEVPVNSCILLEDRRQALDFPRGSIALAFCAECGFIGNRDFQPGVSEYSARYEETQGFSPTFRRFHEQLARRLIDRFELTGKEVLEIGCGKGEFLALLCRLGPNRGLGFDPAYREDREVIPPGVDVRVVRELYSERFVAAQADLVCCKMTLEHIAAPAEFVGMVRRAIGDRLDTDVFFMVPEAARIIDDCAFEDIYYEHCCYFSDYSLGRLFAGAGFNVSRLSCEYEGQYLSVEAVPAAGSGEGVPPDRRRAELTDGVRQFPSKLSDKLATWRGRLGDVLDGSRRAVIWGSGSKGVAFLSTLQLEQQIRQAVDINPHRHGHFMPGSGAKIVAPESLREDPPDIVIAMNPIYEAEIRGMLAGIGLSPELWTL